MKPYLSILSLLIFIAACQAPIEQSSPQSTFVIVHGAWGGGWAFKEVDALLTAKGHTVYRPTLTGQGERVHLASLDVGLNTHIQDVINTILYEELDDVILLGHSYGGMVVPGVVDSIPERIKKLIYLDAFVPEDGESLSSIQGLGGIADRGENGFIIPQWVAEGEAPPTDVPHALKTLTDKLRLNNPLRLKIPTTYILTVDKGKNPEADGFASQAERARKKGWPVLQLEADHNPQWSAPEAFVEMLGKIGGE